MRGVRASGRMKIRRMPLGLPIAWVAAALAAAGCGSDVDAGGSGRDAGPDDDPLAVSDEVEPGTLDEVHREIVAKRCSGQPGLCHNGQFEPNLSTPALFYDYAVRRPALEKPDRLRIVPGDPDASFLVDKLRNRGVSTQMPLGAQPLAEAEIALIESWIRGGALRRPGAEPAPALNNPPSAPEIGVFDASGARLDAAGLIEVAAGTTLTLRHSVSDFETADDEIVFSAFSLETGSDEIESELRQLVLSPGSENPAFGPGAHDPDGPMGNGDRLSRRLGLTIGAEVDLVSAESGEIERVPSAGLTFRLVALYQDQVDDGIAAFALSGAVLKVRSP